MGPGWTLDHGWKLNLLGTLSLVGTLDLGWTLGLLEKLGPRSPLKIEEGVFFRNFFHRQYLGCKS